MLDALKATAAAWLAAGVPAMLVQVLSTRGSVPREAGTRMLVAADGLTGTIGGGHLELKAIALARDLLVPPSDPAAATRPFGSRIHRLVDGLGFGGVVLIVTVGVVVDEVLVVLIAVVVLIGVVLIEVVLVRVLVLRVFVGVLVIGVTVDEIDVIEVVVLLVARATPHVVIIVGVQKLIEVNRRVRIQANPRWS